MRKTANVFTGLVALAGVSANAEILSASADHFELRHEAHSALAADALWKRLLRPADWWQSDHTYSADAANLSLDAQAGGHWREDWPGGSVLHGQVLLVQPGKMIRLQAPFGPLQGLGVSAVWTITIEPADGGSKIVFEEVVTGSTKSNLNGLAEAVDFVKGEAIRSLAGTE